MVLLKRLLSSLRAARCDRLAGANASAVCITISGATPPSRHASSQRYTGNALVFRRHSSSRAPVSDPIGELKTRLEDGVRKSRHCSDADLIAIAAAMPVPDSRVLVEACCAVRFISPNSKANAIKCIGTIAAAFNASYSAKPFVLPMHTICECLMSLKHFDNDSGEINELHTFFAAQIQIANDTSKLRNRHIAGVLFSLRNMRNDSLALREIFSVLSPLIASHVTALSAQETANALSGLRHMKTDIPELCFMLTPLAEKISDSTAVLNAQNVGNIMYGLRGMDSGSPDVCAILSALAPKIAACPDIFRSQHICNALYGLQYMSSDDSEVRAVLAALTPKITSCTEELTAQGVGSALFGFRRMKSEVPEVRAAIKELAVKVLLSCRRFDAQCIGNSLYGLQWMRSDVHEVRALLAAIAPKIMACKDRMSPQEILNALCGMRRKSSNVSEVLLILKALTPKIMACQLNNEDYEKAKSFLRNLDADVQEVHGILNALSIARIEEN